MFGAHVGHLVDEVFGAVFVGLVPFGIWAAIQGWRKAK